MKISLYGYCVGSLWCALALLPSGCASDAASPGSGSAGVGSFGMAGGDGVGGAGSSSGGLGGAVLAGGGEVSRGGANSGGGGSNPSGGAGSGGGSNPSGGAGSGGGAVIAGGSGGAVVGVGGAGSGTPRAVELIGPGAATCGAANATHGDGFVCVLSYPSAGPNVVGYWFDYSFVPSTCNLKMTKPSGNHDANPKVCFSGSSCPTTSGGGLGVALCDVHGIDVSTWPQLAQLESMSKLSSTVKSPFAGCNPGAALTGVSWTLDSGSIPAGMSVLFDDAADKTVARVDAVPAGATSVNLPANVDTSTVASIKFSTSGAGSANWSFCLKSLTVSMR